MRVLRRIRSLVSTHAPQPTPADGSAVVARTDKKSIFTRALQGAVVLGAGLALTVGAAVSPQVAVAATQEGTIAFQQGLATSAANDWQIVSGGYQGNTAADKTADTAFDGQQYVRIQKNVVPTDRENEFKVYLSIDKKEDMRSFFEGSVFGTDNNMSSDAGNWSKINGRHEIYEEDPDVGDKPMYFEIDVVENGEVLYTWTGIKYAPALPGDSKTYFVTTEAEAAKGNKGYCLILGQGTGGDSPDNPIHLTVDVDYEGFDNLFGTVDETAVSLESVTDPLGPCMNSDPTKVQILASDGDASYSDGVITWNPEEKADSEAVNGWYENIAELVYSVELNVQSKDFKSGGIPDGASADSNAIFAVNGTHDDPFATLEYSVTDFHISSSGSTTQTINDAAEFDNPTVRGLLYDLKLQKVDEEGKPLTGAKFKLNDTAGKTVCEEVAVGSDGNLEFSSLPHGNYVLVETQKPEGYDFPDGNPEGETPVTLCYTTQAKNGACCSKDNAKQLSACSTHANNAVNSTVVQIANVRRSDDYRLDVKKVIDGRKWENDSFTFSIKPAGYWLQREDETFIKGDGEQPMPKNDEGPQDSVVIDASSVGEDYGEGSVKSEAFPSITLTQPGEYWYVVQEDNENPTSDDLVYDTRVYLVNIILSDGYSAYLHVAKPFDTESQAKSYLEEYASNTYDAGNSGAAVETYGGIAPLPTFINRYIELDVPSLLNETKTVNGHDAAANEFTFTVEAKSHGQEGEEGYTSADEAAALAGFDSGKLTFDNNHAIAVNQLSEIRTANALHFTAKNVGKTYEYWYAEEPDETGAWHQVDEDGNPAAVVYKVEVSVDWVNADKTELKATLSLYKSTDNGLNWGSSPLDTVTVTSGEEIGEDDKLTVSFINEYGSTLKIVKTDQDGNPLPGAEFTVMGTNPQYSETATTDLNDDGSEAVAAFENIPDGTYTITETVPTGYQKINDMTLEIVNGEAHLYWEGTKDPVGGNGSITKTDGVYTITIMNYVNPDLPSTGSSGTVLMGGLGTAAIVLAGAWLLKQRGIDLGKFTSR